MGMALVLEASLSGTDTSLTLAPPQLASICNATCLIEIAGIATQKSSNGNNDGKGQSGYIGTRKAISNIYPQPTSASDARISM
jgi:hypothetical protein